MQEYCLGFAFNTREETADTVLLVFKNRPDWQAGKLNGIGGKVEEGETPAQAMAREANEEARLLSNPEDWSPVAVLTSDTYRVHIFKMFRENLRFVTMTDEEIVEVGVSSIPANAIFNLHWLIPLCLDNVELADLTIYDRGPM